MRIRFDTERIEKDNEIKQKQLQNERELNRRQKLLLLAMFFALILFTILLIYVLRTKAIIKSQSQEIDIQKENLQHILDNIDQGIISLDENLSIKPDFSKYSEKIFKDSPVNMTLTELLSKIGLTDDSRSLVFELLNASINEELLSWELNKSNLPKIITIDSIPHQIHWTPILQNTKLHEIMISFRDASDSIALKKETNSKEHIISAVKSGLAGKLFLGKINRDSLLNGNLKRENKAEIRYIHTLKGEARNLGFLQIQDILHRLEQQIIENKPNNIIDEVDRLMNEKIELAQVFEMLNLGERSPIPETFFDILQPCIWNAQQRCQNANFEFYSTTKADWIQFSDMEMKELKTILIHSITNCLDHGYFNHLDFLENLKSIQLSLQIKQEIDQIELVIEDYGYGIDWDKLKQLAEQRRYSYENKEQLIQILYDDNTSTVDQKDISSTSGRGVGMAAIANAVKNLSGNISFESKGKGLGSTLKISWTRGKNERLSNVI